MSELPLLGRARELEQLAGCVAGVRGGKGGLWLLRGEAGIGKSRLVEELAAAAARGGVSVAWGRAWEAGGAPPYWPFIQVLRELLQEPGVETLIASLPRVRGAPLVPLLPELAAQLGASTEPQTPEPAARFALLDAVAGLLLRAARMQPRLIVLEDLHAADPATLELLEFVSSQVQSVPLALVGTYRDADAARTATGPALQRMAGRAHTLALGPLTRDEVGSQLEQTTGARPSAALLGSIFTATEGNPLFVLETARLLKAHGGELPGIEQARASRPFVVPSSVRAVIRERLAALAPRTRAVLELGAVVGREFERATLSRLSDESSAELAVPLADGLDAAVLLEVAPGRYRFSHILLREVLHQDLSREQRERLHLRLADSLEARAGAASRAELVHHYSEAGPAGRPRASAAAIAAAEQAEAQFAFAEAARFFQLALDALDRPDDAREAIAVRLRLGRALVFAGELAPGQLRCREAAERARAAGLPSLMAEAALAYGSVFVAARVDETLVALLREALARLEQDAAEADAAGVALRARVMARLAAAMQPASDPSVPIAQARTAIALARTTGDERTLLEVIRAGCSAMMDLGDAHERLALNREHIALAGRLGDRVESLRGTLRSMFDQIELGEVADARAAIDRSERIADELGHPHYAWRIACMQAMRAAFAGDFAQAGRELARAAALGERAGDPNVDRTLLVQRLGLLRQQGRVAELHQRTPDAQRAFAGEPLSEAFIRLIDRSAAVRVGGPARPADRQDIELLLSLGDQTGFDHVAELAAALGDRVLIERVIERIAGLPGRFGHSGMFGMTWEGPVERGLGRLTWAAGRHAEAERAFATALDRAEEAGSRTHLAWAAYDYGRFRLERGDAERGRELLLGARELARELAMPDLLGALERALEPAPSAAAPAKAASAGPAVPQLSGFRLQREGEVWLVECGDSAFRLKDSKGLRMLARLIEEPGRELHVFELIEPGGAIDTGDAGEHLDQRARSAYRARIESLRAELAEAETNADLGRAEQSRQELELLARELARAVGLGGRDRKSAAAAERARVNVQRRLRDAIRRIGDHHPELARHLDWALHTGTFCSYAPR